MNTSTSDEDKKPRPLRPLPLRTARDCSRALARLVNECRRGDLEPKRASVCIFGINVLLSAISSAEFEERLGALENIPREP